MTIAAVRRWSVVGIALAACMSQPAALKVATAEDAAPATHDPGWLELLPGGDWSKHWNTKGAWTTTEDGAVWLQPRQGESGWTRYDAYLWLNDQYEDFEFEVEIALKPHANSGFYFRVGDLQEPVSNGLEVQIYESHSKAAGTPLNDHDFGGIIPGVPPTKNAALPAGEWNRLVVTNKDDKLTVQLNGETVNEVDLTKAPLNSRPKKGYIGFQDHGLEIGLRNAKIRPLD